MALFQSKIGWEIMRQREFKKGIISFRPYPAGNGKFKKNSKTIEKIKKIPIMALFHSKIGWKIMRQRENRNYRSLSSQPET